MLRILRNWARLLILLVALTVSLSEKIGIGVDRVLNAGFEQAVSCRAFGNELSENAGCWPATNCKRRIVDGMFTADEVNRLVAIADKGMEQRQRIGGPTIVDINTGYVRDSAGLDNLFSKSSDIFDSEDFLHYGNIIKRLKEALMETFGLTELHFTAPTFITRIDASIPWKAREMHDEYWHSHADRNNTAHYHYSGLLYLSTYGEDFTGGRLLFYPEDTIIDDKYEPISPHTHTEAEPDLIVEPKAGRVAMFTSGPENTHRVEQVTSGSRYVLSFWFTCDEKRQFEIFLDGKAHVAFSHKMRESIKRRASKSKNDL